MDSGCEPCDPRHRQRQHSRDGFEKRRELRPLDGALNKAADDGRALQAGMADTIAEIQVSTLGASAEYQIAQGAIINMVFKQGSNQFRWDASGYWYPDALISKPVKRPCNCSLAKPATSRTC